APAQPHAEAHAPGSPVGAAPAPGRVVVAVPVAVDPAPVIGPVGVGAVGPVGRGAVRSPTGDGSPAAGGDTGARTTGHDAPRSGGDTGARARDGRPAGSGDGTDVGPPGHGIPARPDRPAGAAHVGDGPAARRGAVNPINSTPGRSAAGASGADSRGTVV